MQLLLATAWRSVEMPKFLVGISKLAVRAGAFPLLVPDPEVGLAFDGRDVVLLVDHVLDGVARIGVRERAEERGYLLLRALELHGDGLPVGFVADPSGAADGVGAARGGPAEADALHFSPEDEVEPADAAGGTRVDGVLRRVFGVRAPCWRSRGRL